MKGKGAGRFRAREHSAAPHVADDHEPDGARQNRFAAFNMEGDDLDEDLGDEEFSEAGGPSDPEVDTSEWE
eukprot:2230841-Pyramimonas_sp.AAC.1